MEIPALLVAVAGAVGLVSAILTVFVGIPRHMRAMYRLEVWALRDELVAELSAGRIRKSRRSIALLNVMEHAIASAHRFTINRLLLVAYTYRDVQDDFLPDGTPDVDELRAYRQRLTQLRVHWVSRTSVLGWLSPVWLPIAWGLYRAGQGLPTIVRALLHPRGATAHLREAVVAKRVDESGTPALKLEPMDPRRLAHCV